MKTTDGFFKNGTKVKFTTRVLDKATGNREIMEVEGVIVGGDYNICTFGREYEIEYTNKFDGRTWTAICVPESKINVL